MNTNFNETEFNKSVGLLIRRARRADDLTQKQIANFLGLASVGYICEVEKGKRALPAYNIYRLERLFQERLTPIGKPLKIGIKR